MAYVSSELVPHSLLWDVSCHYAPHSKERVEKAMKRHREERSDVAISLTSNSRDCFAVAHNDK
jgi:hypothetical protein